MKCVYLLLLSLLTLAGTRAQNNPNFVTTDIDHFWQAYDQIRSTADSVQQLKYLHSLFLDKASPGQKAVMQARNYSPAEYIEAINRYPQFWESIRPNMLRAKTFAQEIEAGVTKLKAIYPQLKPGKVYFTVGVFRTNGTTFNGMVLIGSELAMADAHTHTGEFPEGLKRLNSFFATNPLQGIVFLNVHEFVHTQQKVTIGYNLLTQCVYEGVAEFLAVIATGQESTTPAIAFGKKNEPRVKERFAREMFSPFYNNWLWNTTDNEFKMRDLGYYVGYAIAENHYNKTADKKQAVKELIELDYTNWPKLTNFVDASGYFAKPVAQYRQEYDKNRPTVIGLQGLTNGNQNVAPGLITITLQFSQPMDTRHRGFEWGPLGEKKALILKEFVGFSADAKSATFTADLKPGRRYQIYASNRFRTLEGITLQPYLIDIRTGK